MKTVHNKTDVSVQEKFHDEYVYKEKKLFGPLKMTWWDCVKSTSLGCDLFINTNVEHENVFINGKKFILDSTPND